MKFLAGAIQSCLKRGKADWPDPPNPRNGDRLNDASHDGGSSYSPSALPSAGAMRASFELLLRLANPFSHNVCKQ